MNSPAMTQSRIRIRVSSCIKDPAGVKSTTPRSAAEQESPITEFGGSTVLSETPPGVTCRIVGDPPKWQPLPPPPPSHGSDRSRDVPLPSIGDLMPDGDVG